MLSAADSVCDLIGCVCLYHKEDQSMCEQVVQSHKLMISAGHPPFPPVEKDWAVDDEDKWAHLRTPPLVLKRELIENWNYINVHLPKERDKDELTSSELEHDAIDRNRVESEEMKKKYEVV